MFWTNEKSGLYPYSEDWDRALNEALDKYPITDIGTHTCQIGPYTVWVANYPYASGRLYNPNLERLPKRSTRKRLFEALAQGAIAQAQDVWGNPAETKTQSRVRP